MNCRLVIRGSLAQGEGPLGYVLRMTEANRYPSIRFLMPRWIGTRDAQRTRERVAKVANTLGISIEGITAAGGLPASDKWATFGPHLVSARHLDLRRPKICPSCLRECCVLRAEWDLTLWQACPKHGCGMIFACPACGRPLSWRRPRVDRCCDDVPLESAVAVSAPEAVVDLMTAIASSALRDDRSLRGPLQGLVAHLSLPEILDLVLALGAASENHGLERVRFIRGAMSGPRAYKLIVTAAEALSDWPNGFHDLLERSRNRDVASRHVSQRLEFAYFIHQFDHKLASPSFAFAHDEFDRHVRHRWPGWNTPRGPTVPQGTSNLVTVRDAAIEFGISPDTLRKHFDNGGIKGETRRAGTARRCLLDREHLRIAIGERRLGRKGAGRCAIALSLGEASQRLGVGRRTVAALARSGLLRPVRIMSQPYIESASVSNLLERFEKLLRMPEEESKQSLVTLYEFGRGHHRIPLPQKVQAVLDRRLTPIGVDPSGAGLTKYLFSWAQCKQVILENSAANEWVTVRAASSILHCSFATVQELTRHGLLMGTFRTRRGATVPNGIALTSLAAFLDNYLTTSVIAEKMGVARVRISFALRRQGVMPQAIRNNTNGAAVAVWCREEIRMALGAPAVAEQLGVKPTCIAKALVDLDEQRNAISSLRSRVLAQGKAASC